MRASIFVSAVAFTVASAQSSSTDPAPQTNYLTETNSLGVVTGMPAVETSIPSQPAAATSQPLAVTSQPPVADIPAVGPGVHTLTLGPGGSVVNGSRTVTVSVNNSTTMVLQPPTSSANPTGSDASGSGASRASGSRTGSGASASSTGAAASVKVAAGSIFGFGAIMAAFL
ncbi:hypothetical protein EJ02DRAFT_434520 [Clathrospora elynae]|uniref:Uncharacterized protein n=1 Tax=Clathrospora elynae TaxID=706981 RepID=A0A6A5SQP7_9PLEO|nr:hypothetical protein EJ02DRAFT_434520 [Clathrospora elynae]